MIRFVTILILISTLFYACEEIRSYPPEPEISYYKHSLSDSTDGLGNKIKNLHLEFKFADGDGDLANPNDDTTSRGKIFLLFYEKKFGMYTLFPNTAFEDTLDPIKIPYGDVMRREGQNKTITGKISINYSFYDTPFNPLPFDTFKLEFYITDMEYHKSNIATIPADLSLKH